jgi:hypothetical protein
VARLTIRLLLGVVCVLAVSVLHNAYGGAADEAKEIAARLKSLQCELMHISTQAQGMPKGSKERKELEDKWYATAEVGEKERRKLEAVMKGLSEDETQQIHVIVLTSCDGKPPVKCERGTKYFIDQNGIPKCR